MELYYGEINSKGEIEWNNEESQLSDYNVKFSIYHKEYSYLDKYILYLKDGREATIMLEDHFGFSENEKKELSGKVVDINFIVFYLDGKMQLTKLKGDPISERLKRKITKRMEKFPECKPYTRQGDVTNMIGKLRLEVKYNQNDQLNLRKIESKINDGFTVNKEELNYYVFESKRLGWINCDIFIGSQRELVNFSIEVPKLDGILTRLIFKSYNSILLGDREGNKFVYKNLPLKEPVKIIILGEMEGKGKLKIIDTEITKSPVIIKDIEEYTLAEIKMKLNELN